MRKMTQSKIIRNSLLISLYVQGVLFSQGAARSADIESPQRVEHVWSISGENPDFARESLHEIVSKKTSVSNYPTASFENSDELSDWETGWDTEPKEWPSDDVDTFFPIFEEETPAEKPPIESNQTEADEDWPEATPQKSAPGDISTATTKRSSLIQPFQNIEDSSNASNSSGADSRHTQGELDYPSNIQKGASSLGKQRVSVDSFSLTPTPTQQSQDHRQVITTKKSPLLKPALTKQSQGVFGPYPAEKEIAQNNKHAPLKEPEDKTAHKRHPEGIIAQVIEGGEQPPLETGQLKTPPKTILINFNNVSVIEYIRFISRISNKNFVFDENDLQFNVTIISEEPTTLENVMTALIQELRIHGLTLIEEGNNLIIHRNADVRGISRINIEGVPSDSPSDTELVTQVFRLNTLGPEQARTILRPLLSKQALLEVANETRHLIVTDLVTNIQKVDTLLKSIDAPNSGLVIGQYVVRNAFMDTLIELAKQIMQPIAQDQTLSFVPHPAAKSIFIVSSPFIVERTLSVLQHLDNFQGMTRIYDLEELQFKPIKPTAPAAKPSDDKKAPAEEKTELKPAPVGKWELTPEGVWLFRPGFPTDASPEDLPQGEWQLDPQGNWYFLPRGARPTFRRSSVPADGLAIPGLGRDLGLLPGEIPSGSWILDPQGSWIFQLSPGEDIRPVRLTRAPSLVEELPVGHIDRTKFFIHKLQFTRGEDIVITLQRIAESLQYLGTANVELISTIQSTQWLETTNSLVITGNEVSIEKVKELIDEIDRPQRQVLIEMLVLETTIDDSLTYGVSWGTRSGGGSTSTSQAFIGNASPLVGALSTGGIGADIGVPNAATLATTVGYNLGIIGQRLTHNGTQFATLGALVNAIHTSGESNIVLNPKIITEDNKPAEIFVGVNSPFQTNSVSNDEGSIITTNIEFRDTGTLLRVTPLIGHGDIITLEIEQEVSRTAGQGITGGSMTQDVNLTPTTSINRTTTTVHIPDKHFVIISGMIQEEKIDNRNQFPCLGGIPILGAAFKNTTKTVAKRNLMIFIRPQIIDTAEEFRTLTRRQQEIFKQKNRMKKSWKYEVDEALDFMNIRPPCCDECE